MFDSEIPQGFGSMPTSEVLGVLLATVDPDELSGNDRVELLRARARLAAHMQALVLADMVSVADAIRDLDGLDEEIAFEAAAAEIRAALRLTRRAADAQLTFALAVRRRLPSLWTAIAKGQIDVARAKIIERGTSHLDEPVARRVTREVLTYASGLTTSQLAARIRKLCVDEDPDDATERYRTAVEERRVVVESSTDGTAHLSGYDLPPDRVAAISARINHLARRLRSSSESRTMDQLRADVFLDLLDGKQTATGGTVEVRVDIETLTRLEEHAGELAGFGPVIAEIARKVADRYRDGRWRYVVTDPATGLPVDAGTLRRRPSTQQQRAVEASNPTCIFPGCRMPASGCDLDHRTPYAEGGLTSVGNLVPLCRHDHRIRHVAGWTHEPLPGGDHRWTSRLGRVYTTSGRSP